MGAMHLFLRAVLLQTSVCQKLVSAAAKPLRSVSPLSRRIFSAQDGARQKLKTCPEPSGHKLSESNFFGDDEIVFHLAAMSQCEQGDEGHI
jgi:hypothetical protein